MNDDFLYRIRTEPPAHFAASLKERLDSAPRRQRANAFRLGLGVLLFGTAFAMVVPGVRHTLIGLLAGEGRTSGIVARGVEAPPTPPALTPAPETGSAEEANNTDPASQKARELRPRLTLPTRPSRTVAPAIVAREETREEAPNSSSLDDLLALAQEITPDDLFSSVSPATPWPIVAADAKEAAAVIETRRALFRVIARSFDTIDAASRARRDLDRDAVGLAAFRLLRLSTMIDDAYTIDARRWSDVESANPLVWNQRILFRKQIEGFSESARALLDAAATGTPVAIGNAANRVRQACWQCHAEFSYRRDLPPRG